MNYNITISIEQADLLLDILEEFKYNNALEAKLNNSARKDLVEIESKLWEIYCSENSETD